MVNKDNTIKKDNSLNPSPKYEKPFKPTNELIFSSFKTNSYIEDFLKSDNYNIGNRNYR